MTPIFIIIGLVLNGILAHIIGNVATDRKIGYKTAFLVSFLLSPLIGLLLVIASVPLTDGSSAETAKAPQTKEVQFSENGLSKDNLIVIGIAIVSVICLFLLVHLDLL